MKEDNIRTLEETLAIIDRGSYQVNGKTIALRLSKREMESVHVLLPENVKHIADRKDFSKPFVIGRCGYTCVKMDSFQAACEMSVSRISTGKDMKPVLVLNFASPVNPGGGVRKGSSAQEEDLCRKSSLLLSLESPHARKYYQYSRSLQTHMGSDAMMFSPKVEVIRDEHGNLLNETVVVAVLTCAAPKINHGLEGLFIKEYEDMLFQRITYMLKCAAYFGYEDLVLGAWGCGVFGNDAAVMSDLFLKAFKEFRFNKLRDKDCFRRVWFAVRGGSGSYNFDQFYRNFGNGHFYADEDREDTERALEAIKRTEVHLDKVRGSLFGGAAGDALGYAVEFLPEPEIFKTYGSSGIQEYSIDPKSGKALISDDTQMSLFTANGILVGNTRGCMRGIGGIPHNYVSRSYKDWLFTQKHSYGEEPENGRSSWLLDVPELYHDRAAGGTCLDGIASDSYPGSVAKPINDSKGCGGIMRVAPIGLKEYSNVPSGAFAEEAAELAALTHGHSLGYMTAAVLALIIRSLVYGESDKSLKRAIEEALSTVTEEFSRDPHLNELTGIVRLAIQLSENSQTDLENIHMIGEGWVAEETLGIAVYCALRHQDDFSAGIIAAVNHGGDSDSTGAVTGNILGALLGYEAIDQKWKKDLELSDVILEMADDLCHGCQMEEYSHYRDPDWERKYISMRWKPQNTTELSGNYSSIEEFIDSADFDRMNQMLRDGLI